jgi:prophage DNA circulation protein
MAFGDTLPRMSFGGIEFPYRRYSLRGSQRLVTHEYLRRPGGEVEKLKRRLYEISVECPFHEVFRTYPGLWPTKLAALRALWEAGETMDLVIPTVGTIPAVASTWDQEFMARIRSGEEVRVSFLEDRSEDFLLPGLLITVPATLTALSSQLDGLSAAAGLDVGIFDKVKNAINGVTAILDTGELYASGLEAKIAGVLDAVTGLDRSLSALQQPANWPLANLLHEIGGTAIKLQEDIGGASVPVDVFVVPFVMSIGQVSQRLYGNTSRGGELLRMNDFDNPMALPGGTRVNHYIV